MKLLNHKIINEPPIVGDLSPNYHLASSVTRDVWLISGNFRLMMTSFPTGSGIDTVNQKELDPIRDPKLEVSK